MKHFSYRKLAAIPIFLLSVVSQLYRETPAFAYGSEDFYRSRIFGITGSDFHSFTTSQLLKEINLNSMFTGVSNPILICDSYFDIYDDYSCSYDSVTDLSESSSYLQRITDEDDSIPELEIQFLKIPVQESSLYVIPELYFVSSKYSELLTLLLESIPSRDTPDGKIAPYHDENLTQTALLFTAIYTLTTLIVLFVPVRFVASINRKKFVALKWFFSVILIVLSVIYVFINFPDILIIYSVLKDVQTSFRNFLLATSVGEIGLVFACLLVILAFLKLVRISINPVIFKVIYTHTKLPLLAVLVLLILLVLFISTADLTSYFSDVTTSILILLSLLLYFREHVSQEKPTLIIAQQRLFILGALTTILLGLYVNAKNIFPEYKNTEVDLADKVISKKSVINLPKYIHLKEFTRAVSFITSDNNDVFVNNILVNSKYKQAYIKNLPINLLTSNYQTSIILSPTLPNYIHSLMNNGLFEKIATTSAPSRFFTIEDIQSKIFPDSPKLEITFNCSNGLESKKISINYYSKYSLQPTTNPIKKDLMIFPGCSENTQRKIWVPLDIDNAKLDSYIYEVSGILSKNLANLNLHNLGGTIDLKFYKDFTENMIVYDGRADEKSNNQTMVYNTDLTGEVIITQAAKLNVGNILNELLQANKINRDIKIWSPDTSILVESEK